MTEQEIFDKKVKDFIDKYLYEPTSETQLDMCNLPDLALLLHLALNQDDIQQLKKQQLLIAITNKLKTESFLVTWDLLTNNYYRDKNGQIFIFSNENSLEIFLEKHNELRNRLSAILIQPDMFYNFTIYLNNYLIRSFVLNSGSSEVIIPVTDLLLANLITAKPEYQILNPLFETFHEDLLKGDDSDFVLTKQYNGMMLALANTKVFFSIQSEAKEGILNPDDSGDFIIDEYQDAEGEALAVFTNAWHMNNTFPLKEHRPLLIDIDDMISIAESQNLRIVLNPNSRILTLTKMDIERIQYYGEVKGVVLEYLKTLNINDGDAINYLLSFEMIGLLDLFYQTIKNNRIPENNLDFKGVTLEMLVTKLNFTYLAAFNFFVLAQKNPENESILGFIKDVTK